MSRNVTVVMLLAILCAGSLGMTAPGAVATPALDQVYSQLLDLKGRVLKLEVENRTLKTQMAAMATHTHSMGVKVSGDGGSISLRQLKFDLDHNVCMDCEWMYRVGAQHTHEVFTGPPKL